MIIVNDVKCRNLQQQVAKNMDDIEHLKEYSDLYTTHCLKLSGSTTDVQAQTTAVWTLTAYHKMPINNVKAWPQWIQDALDDGTFSIDSMLFYEQTSLTPLAQFSYGSDREVNSHINCRGLVIGTSSSEERNFSIDMGDFDLDNEFEI